MAVVGVVIIGGCVWAVHRLLSSGTDVAAAPQCTATTAEGTYTVDADQADHAATIAAVGHDLGIPDHGVTIALATALQESKLMDLSSGDRDSVGLFQQRPSEGWGTPAELIDPVYASSAFYDALVKIPDWESLAVTVAAQDVQHSATPDAYAYQEPEARALAVALTGETPAALSCRFSPTAPTPNPAWRASLRDELGGLQPGTAVSAKQGWILAGWLVAHAEQFGFDRVSFAGRTWQPQQGTWRSGGADPGTVQVG